MKSLIKTSTNKLLEANIKNAKNEIFWFLEKKFNLKIESIKCGEFFLNPRQTQIFKDFIERRIKQEPFQYIINEAPFCAFSLYVNDNVLIPRRVSQQSKGLGTAPTDF